MASSSSSGAVVALKSINLALCQYLLVEATIRNGRSNYQKWRKEIELLLTLNEYDIAFDTPQPVPLTDKSTKAEKADFERWTRANKVALSILENGMTDTVRGAIKKCGLASDYINAIKGKFKVSQKAEIAEHMTLLTSYKFEGGISIKDHLMKLTDATEKLHSMDVKICKNNWCS